MKLLLKELKTLRGRLFFNTPMSRHTTIGAGGPAPAFYHPESLSDLTTCIKLCSKKGISLLVIGNGSNIIVADKGINGIVVKLSSPFFKGIGVCGRDVTCGGGLALSRLCHFAEENLLGGSEFLVGIPGTVGGAIIQNAGAYGISISDIIKDVRCLDRTGRVRILKRNQFRFGYRKSNLDGSIIIGATFKLVSRNKRVIRRKVDSYIERRLMNQDYTARSAGCIFKNPERSNLSAAELIDRSGLKEKAIGGAAVSKRHANFIINKKDAKGDDILNLISFVKKKVKRNFGIELKKEVKVLR